MEAVDAPLLDASYGHVWLLSITCSFIHLDIALDRKGPPLGSVLVPARSEQDVPE